ncbi:glutamate decarboxylase [Clostridium tagluense]|uniref:glutamate decarboxylase n=1 Tax=Clostridium tagluense TaxID=360422 RepID=UPI001CF2286C|nr:glutamate decarboxylase [Clostridium tagluense]MCB2310911.1 glutamate decarboxylase [Clostridium tagluense]MCB2315765.1 glutamate decarboxylase [Clostridium tagluense]MCB2320591.1 glutamate decarboxylase [Clostridium tagluense]MCB2325504.1 glutamate decarboxylase [Clostridium tagluense]MCB2330357.1 glutamate decarboxylase [Clostridium tagluense]
MTLFNNKNRDDEGFKSLYTNSIAQTQLPKDELPDKISDPQVIRQLIYDELFMDGNARQNLATFCTTYIEDEVRDLMDLSINKNMIDKDEYPQTAEIEHRCVNILANLWHSPGKLDTIGCSTIGSSEAAILGGLAFKWKWRKRREAEGKSSSNPNIVCGPVQICWHKFARYFDVEIREIPLLPDELCLNPSQLVDYCDENTIGVVATLGSTFTCVYEPVEEIAKALDVIEKEAGYDIPIHVDGASGAFIAPFIQKNIKWDFCIPRVKSINASGHKFGMAPLGVGWVVWRALEDLPEELIFNVDYLGGQMPTFALNFSRPAGQIIAQYYKLLQLGHEGYTAIQNSCANTAQYLGEELSKIDLFEILYDGHGAIPAVCYKLKDEIASGFTLYDLSDRLRMHGWQIASYPLPSNRQDITVQRILIRHGVSRDMIFLLLRDLKKELEILKDKSVLNTCICNKVSFHH